MVEMLFTFITKGKTIAAVKRGLMILLILEGEKFTEYAPSLPQLIENHNTKQQYRQHHNDGINNFNI
jgi:hypothetical protein